MKLTKISAAIFATTVITGAAHTKTADYYPHYGVNAGLRLQDEDGNDTGVMKWDPHLGPNGAWRVKDQNGHDTGVMKWDPYLAPNGGWRRED